MNKCDLCINSRVIISENGYHYICCLSEKEIMECILNNYSRYFDVTRFSNCRESNCRERKETE